MNEHDLLLSFGGQPFSFIQNNPDTGEPEEAIAWNFGLMAITTEGEQNRETRPYLYDALPQAQGAWQGQAVNHHEAARRVLGRNLPAHLQPWGTCGGRAGSRSAELLQLVKIAMGVSAEYKDVSHAWAYFLARRKYNMLRGGDGVAGGSIPEALEEGGYLTREESGDLSFAGRGSDDLAVKWGGGGLRGDELERFLTLAKDNLLVKRVRVRSAQELADGLAIGGVGICSDGQGYSMQRDSRGICRPQGTWWHYHVRSGVRRISQGVDIFQYDQSWGDDTPGGPLLEGCPGNVFGVEWAVQDRLCRSGEVDVLFDMQLWGEGKLTPDLPWVF